MTHFLLFCDTDICARTIARLYSKIAFIILSGVVGVMRAIPLHIESPSCISYIQLGYIHEQIFKLK